MNRRAVGNYNLNPQSENKNSLKRLMVNLADFWKVILDIDVTVGRTGSFHSQRMKDASSEAVIPFGRFRLSSGKYWSVFFFLDWKRTELQLTCLI